MIWTGACATAPRPNPIDPAAREAAAVSTRWIGQTRFWSRTCPVPAAATRWTVSPFFSTAEPAQRSESSLLPSEQRELRKSARRAGLDRFCIYEYDGTDPRPDLPRPVKRRLRPGAAPDKVALAGAAALEDMTADPFQQRFFDQVQSPQAFPGVGPPAVRLTFLDTEPTDDKIPVSSTPRTSAHGYSLMQIAGHLAGGDGGNEPAVQIASRLALPVLQLDPKTKTIQKSESSGGVLGTFADLARALRREIVDWRSRPRSLREQHLVINLSLGWDGEKLGGWDQVGDMPPEVRLIYDTLQFAAHEKVLVIAAAGNERLAPGSKGRPLLPAGWEGRTTPERRWKWWRREAKPLIYAASGVDSRDNPLVNTRALGEAPRVAYADHVVVRDLENPGRVTSTLTGTSVASAVTSTAAALIWQYRPELQPAEVMKLLDASGRQLPRPADFATKNPVRRIALCSALAQAAQPLGLSPADFGCLSTSSLQPQATLWAQLSTLQPGLVLPGLPEDKIGLPSKLPSFDQIEIGPQPGENPCPNCAVMGPPQATLLVQAQPLADSLGFARASFSSSTETTTVTPEPDYRLLIEIPAAWAGSLLQQANVEIFSVQPDGARKPLSICPIGQALPGQVIEVTGCFKKIPAGQAFQASLSFVLAPKAGGPSFSIDSPLFVEYQD
ncbi:MAG TPA: S8 family serine peptidase [Thermoanaerobaculia bacterium]|nr:S8 family serine peptidase [Thermoanaerobaculia bacterium]